MRTPSPRENEAQLSTVAERGRERRRASNTCRGEKEALYKGRAIEASHMGSGLYRGCSEVRAKGSPGATDRAKERGSETEKEGKEQANVHHSPLSVFLPFLSHPGQSAPKVQQSAAMQKTPALLSPPLLANTRAAYQKA